MPIRVAGSWGPGLTDPNQRFERDLQVLDIGGAALVEDDKVDGQLLQAPIVIGLQKFACNIDVLDMHDAQQDDRKVAGYPLSPQAMLSTGAFNNRLGRGTQSPTRVDHMAREPLKHACVGSCNAEMMKLNLCLSPGESACACEGRRISVLICAIEKRFAGRGGHGPKCDARLFPVRCEHAGAKQKSDRAPRRPSW